jgi:predicted lipoprotein with Yx(FWY)xxD motif
MRHWALRLALASGVLAVALGALTACGGTSATVNCVSSGAVICTKSISLDGSTQTVLATHDGKTLYMYKPDTSTTVACTGPCAVAWPPLTTNVTVTASIAGLSGTVGVLAGGNGQQVIYNRHPLYTYGLDFYASDAKGQGAEGGNWHAVTPDVGVLGAPQTEPTPAGTATPPNYNY